MFPAGWMQDNNFKMMVPIMGTIRSMIMGFLAFFKRKPSRKPVVKVIRTRQSNKRAVKPGNTTLYVKRGWTKNKNSYHGY